MTGQQSESSKKAEVQRNMWGEKFIVAFYRLVSIVKMYPDNNQILRDTAVEFTDILTEWFAEEDELIIEISREQFFIQKRKLSFQHKNLSVVKELLEFFEHRMISGLIVREPVGNSDMEQILSFARLISEAEKQEQPYEWLRQKMSSLNFDWIEIVARSEDDQIDEDDRLREIAQKTYSCALVSLKEVSQKIGSQNRAGVSRLKRTVQKMVDFLSQDDSILLGMSTFREYDDYTFTHSVNVAVLSMCLGKRIGLPKVSLSWLGICGMVHDLGKVTVPKEILNKPGCLSKDEFLKMQKHPVDSVSQVLKLHASRELKIKILLPPMEHHMKYDLSGYPRIRRKQPVSLFGRIIAIADVFDALSSTRVYRPNAYSPDRVLSIMWEGSGKDFDPILLKVFIHMLGVYPVGTVLTLDTGEMAIVVPSTESNDRARPQIMIITPDGQGGYRKERKVSLGQRNPSTGAFLRNIVKSEHPSTYGIQPVAFIF